MLLHKQHLSLTGLRSSLAQIIQLLIAVITALLHVVTLSLVNLHRNYEAKINLVLLQSRYQLVRVLQNASFFI